MQFSWGEGTERWSDYEKIMSDRVATYGEEKKAT
jgi:hypothetical protein